MPSPHGTSVSAIFFRKACVFETFGNISLLAIMSYSRRLASVVLSVLQKLSSLF